VANFTFDKEKHAYKLDGKRLTGVTTILGVINKPALIQWAANQAIDFVQKHGETKQGFTTIAKDDLQTARKAHAMKRDKAADKGTAVHEAIEQIVLDWIKDHNGTPQALEVPDRRVQTFIEWAINNDITFKASEVKVYSEKHWYAGTFDLLYERDGRTYIGDIKTSNYIYWTHLLQMAGYDIAISEMRPDADIEGYEIIHMPEKGDLKTLATTELENHRESFLAALTLYRNEARYKELFKFY
jgi:hypothetical protein